MVARRGGWIRQAPNRRGAPVYVVVSAEGLVGEQWRTDDRSNSPDSAYEEAYRAGQEPDTAEQSVAAALALANQLATQLATAHTRVDRVEEALAGERNRADAALALADRTLA